MDAVPSFWISRRVAVADVTGAFGSAIAASLVDAGAVVSGIVAGQPGDESSFVTTRLYERITPIRASRSNAALLAAAFAAHEIELVIDVNRNDAAATHALLNAARVAVPHAAVVVAIPGPGSRLLALANRFRAEWRNPIAVAVTDQADTMLAISRRCVLRDPAVMIGWTDGTATGATTRRAA